MVKAKLEWEIEEIRTKIEEAWILPTMAYNIIMKTDWIEMNNLRINFERKKIEVKEKKVDLVNVKEDLVRGCTMIQVWQIEQLLKEDKLTEIIVWNITQLLRRKEEEADK